MSKKTLTTIVIIVFVLIVVSGCTTSDGSSKSKITKINMEDFFKKYCDIYVNKFQSNDLKSYGIEITNDMGMGYYNTIDDCVKEMLEMDKQSEDACEQYGKKNDINCDEARLTRQESYRKMIIKDGCIENGKNNRCFLFDISQPNWEDASASQISDANVRHTECLQKVEFSCSELPITW